MARLIELLQAEFDVKKLADSESAGKDTCGSYPFCVYCSKKNKYPCGAAIYKQRKEGVKE